MYPLIMEHLHICISKQKVPHFERVLLLYRLVFLRIFSFEPNVKMSPDRDSLNRWTGRLWEKFSAPLILPIEKCFIYLFFKLLATLNKMQNEFLKNFDFLLGFL